MYKIFKKSISLIIKHGRKQFFNKRLFQINDLWKGGADMPRARLTFEEREWLEQVLEKNVDPMEICRQLGISTYQLQMEKKLGWMKKEKRYSAEKAQHALK